MAEENKGALEWRRPAEWESVGVIWMAWPTANSLWKEVKRETLDASFSALAETLGRFAKVKIIVTGGEAKRVAELVPAAEVVAMESNDVWMRDLGATLVVDGEGRLGAADFRFNGWGGKFSADKDAAVAGKMAELLGAEHLESWLTCEGGAIEVNGEGLAMTTESVLLNPNRNSNCSKEEIEEELKRLLGLEDLIWLKGGLDGDDTDGHVDMVARFVGPKTVVALEPKTATLAENLERLQAAGLEVKTLPLVGDVLPGVEGSYANFLILNEGVIVPQYGLETDEEVLALFRAIFPEKEVVGFDCRLIGQEGGGIHCLTQEEWGK